MQLAVYGNLIYDTLLYINQTLTPGGSHACAKTVNKCGGIANFCRALNNNELHTVIHSSIGNDEPGNKFLESLKNYTFIPVVSNTHTSTAYVITDTKTNSRTGIVNWGACSQRNNWDVMADDNSDWHHIMYLDKLQMSPQDISKLKGVVSADFCDIESYHNYEEYHQYIDYYIVSKPSFDILNQYKARRGIIVHDPASIWYIDNQTNMIVEFNPELESSLNVVGAGDYFAANCIQQMMLNSSLDLKQAHHDTLKLLKLQT